MHLFLKIQENKYKLIKMAASLLYFSMISIDFFRLLDLDAHIYTGSGSISTNNTVSCSPDPLIYSYMYVQLCWCVCVGTQLYTNYHYMHKHTTQSAVQTNRTNSNGLLPEGLIDWLIIETKNRDSKKDWKGILLLLKRVWAISNLVFTVYASSLQLWTRNLYCTEHGGLTSVRATTSAIEAGYRTAYAGTVRCTYGMVQLHTSGRYNIRRNVTKSERYKNGTVHDFSL